MKSLKTSGRLKTISAISNGTSGRSIIASSTMMSAALLSSLTTTKGGPLTFTRASAVTVPDYAGVLQTLGNNVPAFDGMRLSYLLSDGSTRGAELSSGGLTVGTIYEITAQSALDFTTLGSASNAVGTIFKATAAGTLSATDKAKPCIPTWISTALDGTPLTGRGILSEGAATNIFANSAAPATQTITVTAAQYVLSFYGTGSIAYSGVATGTLVGTGASNRVQVAFTPTAGSLILTLTGTITNPQLELSPTGQATSPAISSGATTTRAATILSEPIADLPASGAYEIQLALTPNGIDPLNRCYLLDSMLDTTNRLSLTYDQFTVIFTKIIAGVASSCVVPFSATVNTTFTVKAKIFADNSMGLTINDTLSTINNNTTRPVLGTALFIGSDALGVNQFNGSIQ